MRKTFRQNKDTGKFEEVNHAYVQSSAAVHVDMAPFVSPIDGSIINSRSDLRSHNAKHNVVQQHEYGNEMEHVKARKEKEKQRDRKVRKEKVIHAVEAHRDNHYTTFENYRQDHK